MPVLKQHNNVPAMREAIVLDLGDIGAQAARIRASAETQAQQIIAAAEAKAEKIVRERSVQAQETGYAEGLEAGVQEGRQAGRAEALAQASEQLAQLTAAWSTVIGEWEQQRHEMEREARQSVVDFALATAEKVVHRVIQVDEGVVVDQAAQALSLVLSSHNASVRIHPVDRPLLNDAIPQLLGELSSIEHIDLIDDEAITPGGCIVSFGQGEIDATIETQMQRLVDMILPEPIAPQEPQEAQAQASVEEPGAIDEAPAPVDTPEVPQQEAVAPVYEITEDGLVESAPPPAPEVQPQAESADPAPEDEQAPGSEA